MVIYAEHLFRNPHINMRNMVESICYADCMSALSRFTTIIENPYDRSEPEYYWYRDHAAYLGVVVV